MDHSKALRKLLDREEIWDCLLRYTRGVDRLDKELLVSAYHPDATDDHAAFVGSREELADLCLSMHGSQNTFTQHQITNFSCDIDGDMAHTEVYFTYYGVTKGSTDVIGGRYVDRFERRKGEWRIAERLCLIEWSSSLHAGSDTGTTVAMSDVESLRDPRTLRSRSDPSYARPLRVNTQKKIPSL